MKNSEIRKWWLPLLVAVFVVFGIGGPAQAATLFVANNGVDSDTCGAKNDPCRSISKAIANANEGDRIVVGPGRYGDLNEDGIFDPNDGDEASGVDAGCGCMIFVDKQLTIASRAGADATVLDAGGKNISVVRVQASGAVFGKPKKGFTLTKGDEGLRIPIGTSGVKVAGNIAHGNTFSGFVCLGDEDALIGNQAIANGAEGFLVDHSGHELKGNLAGGNGTSGFSFIDTDGLLLSGNEAIANGDDGFKFLGVHSGNELSGNLASGNGSTGFLFVGEGHELRGNQASNNGAAGFSFGGEGHVLRGNQASANGADGFSVDGIGHELRRNAAVGNRGVGIGLVGGSSATITNNNIYGNNSVPSDFWDSTNGGLVNASGGEIDATNNFWGAITGPGDDPADAVLNLGASSTLVEPFATKEFKVKSRRSH